MKLGCIFLFTALITAGATLQARPKAAMSEPLEVRSVRFKAELAPGSNGLLVVDLSLKPEHKAYVDRFELKAQGFKKLKHSKLKLKPVERAKDPHSDKMVKFVSQDFSLETVIEIPENLKDGAAFFELELRYQACTAKYCYTPKVVALALAP